MPSVYIISGDDEFARKRYARELIASLCNGNTEADDSLEIISGDSDTLKCDEMMAAFLESWRTPPFLSDSKVVWLKHHPDLALLQDAKSGSVAEAVAQALLSPPDDTVKVVIDGPGLDLRSSFAKSLKSAGAAIEMRRSGKSNDRDFAVNRRNEIDSMLAAVGKNIAADAAQFLIDAAGSGSGTLANEVEKLIAYTGDSPRITLADCRAVVSRTPETMSWMYTAAIIAGDLPDALRQLKIMLAEGQGMEMRVAAALSGEYQKQIQTHLALAELGITRLNPQTFSSLPEEVKTKYPKNPLLKLHPYRAFKICEAAMAIPPEELARKLSLIRSASLALVSGGNPLLVLESLTRRLAQKTIRSRNNNRG